MPDDAALNDAGREQVEAHYGLVRRVAADVRFTDLTTSFDDISQDGMLGLIDAVLRDNTGGNPSTRYLKCRIRGAILDGMRKVAWSLRAQDGQGAERHPHYLAEDPEFDIEDERCDGYHQVENIDQLKHLVDGLTAPLDERETVLLYLYYWKGLTMREVGDVLHLTESRVSQIHRSVIERLRACDEEQRCRFQ